MFNVYVARKFHRVVQGSPFAQLRLTFFVIYASLLGWAFAVTTMAPTPPSATATHKLNWKKRLSSSTTNISVLSPASPSTTGHRSPRSDLPAPRLRSQSDQTNNLKPNSRERIELARIDFDGGISGASFIRRIVSKVRSLHRLACNHLTNFDPQVASGQSG